MPEVRVVSRPMGWVLGFSMLGVGAFLAIVIAVEAAYPHHAGMVALGAPIFMLGVIALLLFEAQSRVVVGSDGVRIRRHFDDHFVPFSEIVDAAEVDGVVIRFFLRSGECLDLYTGKDENAGKPAYVERCNDLIASIWSGISRYNKRIGEAEGASPTASEDDLRHRAHRVLRGETRAERTPYRSVPAPDASTLIGLVDADDAAPAARGAAAVLLAQESDDEGRARLRVAAESTAHPKLRILFRLAVDDGSPAELEEALEAIEAEARTLKC